MRSANIIKLMFARWKRALFNYIKKEYHVTTVPYHKEFDEEAYLKTGQKASDAGEYAKKIYKKFTKNPHYYHNSVPDNRQLLSPNVYNILQKSILSQQEFILLYYWVVNQQDSKISYLSKNLYLTHYDYPSWKRPQEMKQFHEITDKINIRLKQKLKYSDVKFMEWRTPRETLKGVDFKISRLWDNFDRRTKPSNMSQKEWDDDRKKRLFSGDVRQRIDNPYGQKSIGIKDKTRSGSYFEKRTRSKMVNGKATRVSIPSQYEDDMDQIPRPRPIKLPHPVDQKYGLPYKRNTLKKIPGRNTAKNPYIKRPHIPGRDLSKNPYHTRRKGIKYNIRNPYKK